MNIFENTFSTFWKEYSDAEIKIYKHILSHKDEHLKGKVGDLANTFDVDKVIFVGFLDGVQTSLRSGQLEMKKVTLDTDIDLDIDEDDLFGCGVTAVNAWKCTRLFLEGCTLRDCSASALCGNILLMTASFSYPPKVTVLINLGSAITISSFYHPI